MESSLSVYLTRKYGVQPSPYVAARRAAGYLSPEDRYELVLDSLVTIETTWLDVGCGRSPLPNNPSLARELSNRSKRFVGIDPDTAVLENDYTHDRQQVSLDDFRSEESFDLVTARMVVEHVQVPSDFAGGLTRVTRIGSRVVLFTVNWLSVTALAAHFTPISIHNAVKSRLWATEDRDTFPTAYRMNQRRALRSLMECKGFREESFAILADASLFWRLPVLRDLELRYWQISTALRVPYPDSCILAVYQRVG